MPDPIFVYGTLRDPDVLLRTLGPLRDRVTPVEAGLPDHRAMTSAQGPFPVLVPEPGHTAPGHLLIGADEAVIAALDQLESVSDFARLPCEVVLQGRGVRAQVYRAGAAHPTSGTPWDLRAWQAREKPLFLAIAEEVMERGSALSAPGAEGGALMRRALARVAAQKDNAPVGDALRSWPAPDAIDGFTARRIHSGFFALEEQRYRHRRFDGAMSEEVVREVFISGDAVSVLPWDPVTDEVLLIEQIRAALIARQDPNPWNIEVIAGLTDRDEPPEATARREAEEESGLTLGRLEQIGRYYSSPGAVTEFITSFIAEADLSGYTPGVHGLDGENEDIRTFVIPRETALRAVQTGEARNAPLIISLLGLERVRPRLLQAWVGGVAAPGASD